MVDTFDISLMKVEVCALASRIRLAMGTCRRSKHVAILPSSLDMLPIYPLTTIQVEMDVATALVDVGFIGIECALRNTRDQEHREITRRQLGVEDWRRLRMARFDMFRIGLEL